MENHTNGMFEFFAQSLASPKSYVVSEMGGGEIMVLAELVTT